MLYALLVPRLAQLGLPRLVARFGSESGSMIATIGSLPSYCLKASAIGSAKLPK